MQSEKMEQTLLYAQSICFYFGIYHLRSLWCERHMSSQEGVDTPSGKLHGLVQKGAVSKVLAEDREVNIPGP